MGAEQETRREEAAEMKLQSVSGALTLSLVLTLTLTLVLADNSELKPPTVNIYSQTPVEYGMKNTLICHTSGFHPPRISITMKKNGVPIPDCSESDLSFGRDWTYYVTKHVEFTPQKDDTWECEVQHNEMKPQTFRLEIF